MTEQEKALAEAIAFEQEIAARASEIRAAAKDGDGLTSALFMELYPLLCEPIPSAFIQTVGKVDGKPYVSTGVRSVQVQIDRMNNVLTPLWWWYEDEYSADGALAKVTVCVGDDRDHPLVARSSRGGVRAAKVLGNTYKGAFTNAGKVAFARVGPGHEVYLGAADLDPDVNQEVAEAKPANGKDAKGSEIGKDIAGKLAARVWALPAAKEKLQLAASHVAERDVGDCGNKARATGALASLTFEQAERVDAWIAKKEAEAALPAERVQELVDAIDAAKPQLAEEGQNWLDGLNGVLAALKIDGIGPREDLGASLARLAVNKADSLENALKGRVPGESS